MNINVGDHSVFHQFLRKSRVVLNREGFILAWGCIGKIIFVN